jgi:hypothetical protein
MDKKDRPGHRGLSDRFNGPVQRYSRLQDSTAAPSALAACRQKGSGGFGEMEEGTGPHADLCRRRAVVWSQRLKEGMRR